MTAPLIAILSLTVLGIPIALAVDRRARGPLLIGTSFLYGSGTIYFVMLLLSIAHVRWTLTSVTIGALVIFCAAALVVVRRRPVSDPHQFAVRPHLLDLVTLLTITGYALYATLAPLWEWDFWAIWGLKAKVFLETAGIDWRFLESRWNTFAHPDYPLLLPMNFDFVALVSGGWSDRWLGLLFVAWGVALLLIIRALASRETSAFFASLLTLTIASLAVSRYLGMAEGALIAFGGAGVLFVRAALRGGGAASWRHGALMLGLAANCKNEGVAMLVAVTIAAALAWPRRATAILRNLWPAYALTAPWLILRFAHTLPTDLASGSAASRLAARLPHALQLLQLLAAHLYEPWFWMAILIGILVATSAARRAEAFVLLVTAIQIAFYVVAYLATPHDLRWHIVTSWSRLTGQIAVPITFAVFLMLANSLRRGEDAPHAEARSDQ
ncbi:MAG: hypothetical protein QOK37_2783 [Thermoanaerobaculia bacterium]|jgi:hypothetical protein|nr:hypothetical protein [Thermoanaerobaculia bacterium]